MAIVAAALPNTHNALSDLNKEWWSIVKELTDQLIEKETLDREEGE
jgi:hypothetical protein